MQPATANTTPRKLTERLVRSPANIRVIPTANTIGHAVGAGSSMSTVARSLAMAPSAPDHVHDGEDDDPHGVDEVPVERERPDARRVLAADEAGDGEDRHDRHQHDTDGDVERVQSDERVVRRPE